MTCTGLPTKQTHRGQTVVDKWKGWWGRDRMEDGCKLVYIE